MLFVMSSSLTNRPGTERSASAPVRYPIVCSVERGITVTMDGASEALSSDFDATLIGMSSRLSSERSASSSTESDASAPAGGTLAWTFETGTLTSTGFTAAGTTGASGVAGGGSV